MDENRAPRGLYGRKKGHPLKPRQAHLMESLLPKLALDPESPRVERPGSLFPHDPDVVRLEIGFGGGEHLVHQARTNPDIGIVGCEPFLNGMAKALSAIDDHGLGNIRLFGDDALHLLSWLPDASLDRVDLLYPDPWPKRRHWKRRFVSAENLSALARLIRPGGEFRFASDIGHYVNWTLRHCRDHPAFDWQAETADDWRKPWPGWPGTRYEQKAVAAGRVPAYLTFVRV